MVSAENDDKNIQQIQVQSVVHSGQDIIQLRADTVHADIPLQMKELTSTIGQGQTQFLLGSGGYFSCRIYYWHFLCLNV